MRLPVAAVAFAIVACGTPSPVQPKLQPRLEQPFTLRLTQTAEFPDLGLTITFRRVPSDSRCPRTVVCVWEGNGEVELLLRMADSTRAISLNTALDPREALVGAHRLVLRGLFPEPPLRVEEYLATLELHPQ